MIKERALRQRKDAEARLEDAEMMELRARERAKAVISKAKTRSESKSLDEARDRDKGRKDVVEGGGIGIKNIREKNSIEEVYDNAKEKNVAVKDYGVKEEVRGDKGAVATEDMTVAAAVSEEEMARRRIRKKVNNNKNSKKKCWEKLEDKEVNVRRRKEQPNQKSQTMNTRTGVKYK